MRRIRQIARRVAQFLFAETTSPAGRQCCEPLESRTLLTVPYGTLNFNFENTHTVTAVFTDQPNGQGQPVNVSPSLINEDLSLERDVGTDTFVPAAQIALSYSGTNPATFSFSGFGPQHIPPSVRPEILPNGNYRASISKQDVLSGTDEMAADALLDFFVLAGDANRNRVVSLPDYNILAANFGQTNRTFSQGNFDYDPGGNVNQADYDVLAAHFGATVPVPPTAPNEIVVGFATSSTLTVQWLDNVVGETGFRIQQSSDGQIFDVYYNYPATPAIFESFTVPNLQDGKRYWFRVRAYSDPATNPNGPNTAYTPKRAANTILPAPGNLTVTPVSASELRLNWVDLSQNEMEFRVFRSPDGMSNWTQVGMVQMGATEFFTPILDPPTQQFYYVQAHNDVTDSAPSNIATSPPAPPTNLTVAYVPAGTRMDLDWDNNSEPTTTYNVYRGTDPEFEPALANRIASGLTASNFSDLTITPGTRYTYRLTAVANGSESFMGEPTTEVASVNQQPSGLAASVVDDISVELYWSDNSANETGFIVDVFDSFGGLVGSQSVPPNSDNTFIIGLQPESDYTLTVRATFPGAPGGGESPDQVSATTRASDQMLGLILAVAGHFQGVDLNNGMGQIVTRLRNLVLPGGLRYRVLFASEDRIARLRGGLWVEWDGRGTLFDLADAYLDANFIRHVAVIGYSHGGGVLDNLVNRLVASRPPGVVWAMRYAATIDAIQRGPIDNILPAFAETSAINAGYHFNAYNTAPFQPFPFLPGFNPLKGAEMNGALNQGYNQRHVPIQYHVPIHDIIVDDVQDLVFA